MSSAQDPVLRGRIVASHLRRRPRASSFQALTHVEGFPLHGAHLELLSGNMGTAGGRPSHPRPRQRRGPTTEHQAHGRGHGRLSLMNNEEAAPFCPAGSWCHKTPTAVVFKSRPCPSAGSSRDWNPWRVCLRSSLSFCLLPTLGAAACWQHREWSGPGEALGGSPGRGRLGRSPQGSVLAAPSVRRDRCCGSLAGPAGERRQMGVGAEPRSLAAQRSQPRPLSEMSPTAAWESHGYREESGHSWRICHFYFIIIF